VLTQIKLDNDAQVNLPILGVTPKNSLLIQKVTGLNPPDRSLFIGDYSQDGGIYQGRRVGSRNIVFTINLNPNPALGETVSSLRESLYKAFIDPQVDGDYLKVVLHDEAGNERYLVGYCEKFESEIFDVETMCQISMICPDPYIRDNTDTIHIQPTGWTSFPYVYQGSAETGFIVRIYVTTQTNKITLNNNDKVMKLEAPSNYGVGDIIIINTIRGQRSITLTTTSSMPTTPTEFTLDVAYPLASLVFYGAGVWKAIDPILITGATPIMAPGNNNDYWEFVSTPIVSHLTPKSQWLELHSVNNTMKVYEADSRTNYVANIKYLKYTSAYWGI
jgi:Phage tail protein